MGMRVIRDIRESPAPHCEDTGAASCDKAVFNDVQLESWLPLADADCPDELPELSRPTEFLGVERCMPNGRVRDTV